MTAQGFSKYPKQRNFKNIELFERELSFLSRAPGREKLIQILKIRNISLNSVESPKICQPNAF